MECPICNKDSVICTCIENGKATLYCNTCDEEKDVPLWEAVRMGLDIGGSKNSGKWIRGDFTNSVMYSCSVCGVSIYCCPSKGEDFRLYNYCFNCGAKMDLDDGNTPQDGGNDAGKGAK